jgi:hypothetical protein
MSFLHFIATFMVILYFLIFDSQIFHAFIIKMFVG